MNHGVGRSIPNAADEFNELLERIDAQLRKERVSIGFRPLRALGVVSSEYGIPLPLGPLPHGTSEPAGKNWPISERILAWYRTRYGDRLKSNLGPGRMAVLIRNDVWVFRFPRFYGSVKIIASRTGESIPMTNNRQPAMHNILDSIDKLPARLRGSLTEHELQTLYQWFISGHKGFQRIQSLAGDDLIKSALADIDACVGNLSGDKPNFGLAKWSSLQAGEKVLKAAIHRKGAVFSRTHDLSALINEASRAGLCLHIDSIIASLQCSPGIRYGEEACGLREAIDAHHAVFTMASRVTEALRSR